MYNAWRIIRTLAAFIGFGMMLLAVGTSDYHVMELGQSEPGGVWKMLLVGAALMAPAYVHAVIKEWKEGQEEDVQD